MEESILQESMWYSIAKAKGTDVVWYRVMRDIINNSREYQNFVLDEKTHDYKRMKYELETGNNMFVCGIIDIDDESITEQYVREFIRGERKHIGGNTCTNFCDACGKEAKLELSFDNGVITATSMDECEPIPTTWEVTFPSGRVLIEDVVPYVHNIMGDMKFTDHLGGLAEQLAISHYYASHGAFHAYVGNTCPKVSIQEDNSILIGCAYWGDYTNNEPEIPFPGTEITSVCTDMWWASIIDVESIKTVLDTYYEYLEERKDQSDEHNREFIEYELEYSNISKWLQEDLDDENFLEIPAGTYRVEYTKSSYNTNYVKDIEVYATLTPIQPS